MSEETETPTTPRKKSDNLTPEARSKGGKNSAAAAERGPNGRFKPRTESK